MFCKTPVFYPQSQKRKVKNRRVSVKYHNWVWVCVCVRRGVCIGKKPPNVFHFLLDFKIQAMLPIIRELSVSAVWIVFQCREGATEYACVFYTYKFITVRNG